MVFYLIYLLLINALSFLLMLADKRRAVKNKWRIPEKVLFSAALFGGSLGTIAGMYLFRHKTRKTSFTVGVPVILALQILLHIFLIL